MGMEHAINFQVCNPAKSNRGDFVEYTVLGRVKGADFEITRRYSDFEALRKSLKERFIGLYVPPIPGKKAVGN
jgi:sorting nexin-1/2